MQDFRKLLFRGLVFALIFLAVDQTFAAFNYREINIFARAAEEKMSQAADDLLRQRRPVEWLFMGSSHAQFGFDTDAIGQAANRPSYNLGYGDGFHLGEQQRLLDGYLGVSRPKLIVLAVDVFALNAEATGTGQLIAPFVSEAGSVSLTDEWRPWLAQWPLRLKSFRYGRNILRYTNDARRGNRALPAYRHVDTSKSELKYFSRYNGYTITPTGFVRGDALVNPAEVRYGNLMFAPDAASLAALSAIADRCRAAGIPLVLVNVPEHASALRFADKYVAFQRWMQAFAGQHGVTYLDFDNRDAFPVDRDDLFFDSDHLNAAGAALFATLLVPHLQAIDAGPASTPSH